MRYSSTAAKAADCSMPSDESPTTRPPSTTPMPPGTGISDENSDVLRLMTSRSAIESGKPSARAKRPSAVGEQHLGRDVAEQQLPSLFEPRSAVKAPRTSGHQ